MTAEVSAGQVWTGTSSSVLGRVIRIDWSEGGRAGYTVLRKASGAQRSSSRASVSVASVTSQYELQPGEGIAGESAQPWRRPSPGEAWIGRYGVVRGRVIMIDSADDSHVTYTVTRMAPGRVSPRRGRIAVQSLRASYRPALSREDEASAQG